ncbi:hypothetical protein SODALDRAFT_359268 [Sodiomyces alkalinus F11]|uniref:Uncharacterized protein n=1 Tax=Sodiomyces alkalinus (strain CBS 110278 / VKM F-3762 / F11) TaxID=1314773 RepID=A0A3N2PYF1_SODAK|nr:hypothetical protein SODALDRAFT_359268 [Sodiomyces alkalinus F11]ROT39375.1 hypothetical protein SODALDRAFT_359268 [Sodiomyces alkalinus F11]
MKFCLRASFNFRVNSGTDLSVSDTAILTQPSLASPYRDIKTPPGSFNRTQVREKQVFAAVGVGRWISAVREEINTRTTSMDGTIQSPIVHRPPPVCRPFVQPLFDLPIHSRIKNTTFTHPFVLSSSLSLVHYYPHFHPLFHLFFRFQRSIQHNDLAGTYSAVDTNNTTRPLHLFDKGTDV